MRHALLVLAAAAGWIGATATPAAAAFIEAVEVPVHLPLGGRTMAFDGAAACVSGC